MSGDGKKIHFDVNKFNPNTIENNFGDLKNEVNAEKGSANEKEALLADLENIYAKITLATAGLAEGSENSEILEARRKEFNEIITELDQDAKILLHILISKPENNNLVKAMKWVAQPFDKMRMGLDKWGKGGRLQSWTSELLKSAPYSAPVAGVSWLVKHYLRGLGWTNVATAATVGAVVGGVRGGINEYRREFSPEGWLKSIFGEDYSAKILGKTTDEMVEAIRTESSSSLFEKVDELGKVLAYLHHAAERERGKNMVIGDDQKSLLMYSQVYHRLLKVYELVSAEVPETEVPVDPSANEKVPAEEIAKSEAERVKKLRAALLKLIDDSEKKFDKLVGEKQSKIWAGILKGAAYGALAAVTITELIGWLTHLNWGGMLHNVGGMVHKAYDFVFNNNNQKILDHGLVATSMDTANAQHNIQVDTINHDKAIQIRDQQLLEANKAVENFKHTVDQAPQSASNGSGQGGTDYYNNPKINPLPSAHDSYTVPSKSTINLPQSSPAQQSLPVNNAGSATVTEAVKSSASNLEQLDPPKPHALVIDEVKPSASTEVKLDSSVVNQTSIGRTDIVSSKIPIHGDVVSPHSVVESLHTSDTPSNPVASLENTGVNPHGDGTSINTASETINRVDTPGTLSSNVAATPVDSNMSSLPHNVETSLPNTNGESVNNINTSGVVASNSTGIPSNPVEIQHGEALPLEVPPVEVPPHNFADVLPDNSTTANNLVSDTDYLHHVDAPHVESHVEPPHVEPPHVEPPHVEPPHVEPPHVEPPHVEPPHVEPPAHNSVDVLPDTSANTNNLIPDADHLPHVEAPVHNFADTSTDTGNLIPGGNHLVAENFEAANTDALQNSVPLIFDHNFSSQMPADIIEPRIELPVTPPDVSGVKIVTPIHLDPPSANMADHFVSLSGSTSTQADNIVHTGSTVTGGEHSGQSSGNVDMAKTNGTGNVGDTIKATTNSNTGGSGSTEINKNVANNISNNSEISAKVNSADHNAKAGDTSLNENHKINMTSDSGGADGEKPTISNENVAKEDMVKNVAENIPQSFVPLDENDTISLLKNLSDFDSNIAKTYLLDMLHKHGIMLTSEQLSELVKKHDLIENIPDKWQILIPSDYERSDLQLKILNSLLSDPKHITEKLNSLQSVQNSINALNESTKSLNDINSHSNIDKNLLRENQENYEKNLKQLKIALLSIIGAGALARFLKNLSDFKSKNLLSSSEIIFPEKLTDGSEDTILIETLTDEKWIEYANDLRKRDKIEASFNPVTKTVTILNEKKSEKRISLTENVFDTITLDYLPNEKRMVTLKIGQDNKMAIDTEEIKDPSNREIPKFYKNRGVLNESSMEAFQEARNSLWNRQEIILRSVKFRDEGNPSGEVKIENIKNAKNQFEKELVKFSYFDIRTKRYEERTIYPEDLIRDGSKYVWLSRKKD